MKRLNFLSNNVLKIIAAIAMVFDHVGVLIFPKIAIFRIIGRIAFPIFAYMFAEGCFYTKNKLKHFLILFIFALVVQIGYYIAMQSLSFSIFGIFLISLALIRLFDLSLKIKDDKKYLSYLIYVVLIILIIGLYFLNLYLPYFKDNYGFFGMIIPFVIYVAKKIYDEKFFLLIVLTTLLGFRLIIEPRIYAEYSFLALIFLLFYNGERGKLKLKYFFYIFYPLHLIIIYLIYYLLNK